MFKTLNDLDAGNKTILVRADLNVPLQEGKVSDLTRLERLLPTVRELSDKGARVVILSHFGRPKGKDSSLSLKPISQALSEVLQKPVAFADDCVGDVAASAIKNLKAGDVIVLENLRFHKEEEKNDENFAKELAKLGDAYVNDAFSAAHRAHASTEGLAHILPAYAGRLMEEELKALDKALTSPERPVMAIVGGAKISTKLELLGNMIARVQFLALGGAMANTFVAAQGHEVGASLCEYDMLPQAKEIMAKAEEAGCKLILPVDAIVAQQLSSSYSRTITWDEIHKDEKAFDIGPKSIENITNAIKQCKTLVWNGPLGIFEVKPYDKATNQVAQFAAAQTQDHKLLSVGGGGDTNAALNQAGVMDQFSYISAAGGAFLEWLEGKTLPGVKALEK